MNGDTQLTTNQEEMPEDTGAAVEILWRQNRALLQQVQSLRTELDQVSAARKLLFHPVMVLLVSLASGLAFSGLVILNRELQGDRHFFFLYYMVPVSVPFVAFLFDRLKRWRELTPYGLLIDLPVIGLAMARALAPVPVISGHVLFLTYALLTARSPAVTVTAALVLLQVAYLKAIVWRDPTLIGGILVAFMAASIFFLIRRVISKKEAEKVS